MSTCPLRPMAALRLAVTLNSTSPSTGARRCRNAHPDVRRPHHSILASPHPPWRFLEHLGCLLLIGCVGALEESRWGEEDVAEHRFALGISSQSAQPPRNS